MTSRAVFAAALLTTTLGVVREARAFEVKHAAGGELVRWRRDSVVWTIDRSVRRVIGGEEAIIAATDAWTQRGGAPALTVGTSDAVLEPGFDRTNGVFFVPGGYAPAGTALAITVLTFDDKTGEVLDADIVLNGHYQIGLVDPSAPHPKHATDPGAETYDVTRIMAHEMGHALGLSDERGLKDVLMYPYVARARALPAAPASDDVAGVRALYGSAAPEDSSGACTGGIVASSGLTAAPATVYAAAGLVIAALVMSRRGRRGARVAAGCGVVVAAGIVVLPPIRSGSAATWVDVHAADRALASNGQAVVASVHTTSVRGLFRSELELGTTECATTRCPAVGKAIVWGGTIGGVRQIVGGAQVPAAGDHVQVIVDGDAP